MSTVQTFNQPSPDTITRMKGQKIRNTQCEMELRRLLHSMGLRYRVHVYPLKGLKRKADIVFRSPRLAVFVDGCFWHGCKEHRSPSKTNTEWWSQKIQGNRSRDADTDKKLRKAGWCVIRSWEHENPIDVAARIRSAVDSRRNIIR